MVTLATILQAMGDLGAATRYYEQAISILQVTLGEDHTATRQAIHQIEGLRRASA
jgi:hypothetical protein